jgi:hypothetical protein
MNVDRETKIQLTWVAASIPFLVGAIFWLSTIYSTAADAQRINEKQDLKLETQMSLLLDIRDRVIRIEEKVNRRGE